MAGDLVYVDAPFVGKNLNDDGTMTVFGTATSPALDADKQICDPAWLAKAMPAWFETGANVREQHSKIAAGVGTELTRQAGDSWDLSALVVDPVSVLKVDKKVLTGFSIGISGAQIIKDASAPGGRIIGGDIVEVSLVDRPANPTCKLMLAKSDGGALVKVEDLTNDAGTEDAAADAADENAEDGLIAAARSALVALLGGEVDELGEGGSLGPVRILVGLLDDLSWFAECDAHDDAAMATAALIESMTTTREEPDVLELSAVATLVKAAAGRDADADDKSTLAEIRKALGVDDLAAQTDKSIAKATKATEERLTTLEADIAKVLALPEPGGPILAHRTYGRRPPDPRLAEAARLDQLATRVTDLALKEGYAANADRLRSHVRRGE
jgi:hypothetical protein